MRILLTLTCCVGLACFTQAAQQPTPPPKKKPVQQSNVTPKPQFTRKTHTVTNTPHVQTLHKTTTLHNTNTNLSKAPLRTTTQGQTKVQTFHAQHFNLANKPNPNIPNVKFQANNHIAGAQNWKGQNVRGL